MTSLVFGKRVIAVIVSIMIAITFMPVFAQDAYGAAKKPGTPKIISAKVKGNTVTLKWTKAKNARTYRVYKTSGTYWKYWKKVKKSQRKKYSNKKKYKLRKSGSRYKVYKKAYKYSCLKKGLISRTYKFRGRYSTKYRFAVRAFNGKKAGRFSAAKAVRTKADPDDGPVTTVPGKVQNLQVKAVKYHGYATTTIRLTWDADRKAESYEIWYIRSGKKKIYSITTTEHSKGIEFTYHPSCTCLFKVRAINSIGKGEFSDSVRCKTGRYDDLWGMPENPGPYSNNPYVAWKQYERAMLKYYKEELAKRGVDIKSTDKADEFQKLHAIIQVMHDRVGLSERREECTTFPTECSNWFYLNNYDTSKGGEYYNGKDYLETIEFYADCWVVADTECFLAEKAGLNNFIMFKLNSSHRYAIIQANNVWYNADAFLYMLPGCAGLRLGGCIDPSYFDEVKYNGYLKLSEGTGEITDAFSLTDVFYGTGDAITSDKELLLGGFMRIRAEDATYESSDESIINFDNKAGTYTLHKPGIAYITITYKNLSEKTSSYKPTCTTTVSLEVRDE